MKSLISFPLTYVWLCMGDGVAYLRGGIGRRSVRSGMAIRIRFVKMFVCDMDQSQSSPEEVSKTYHFRDNHCKWLQAISNPHRQGINLHTALCIKSVKYSTNRAAAKNICLQESPYSALWRGLNYIPVQLNRYALHEEGNNANSPCHHKDSSSNFDSKNFVESQRKAEVAVDQLSNSIS